MLPNGEGDSSRLDRSLLVAVASGLVADTYLPFAQVPGFTRSPLGLFWPAATTLLLLAVIANAARTAWRATIAGRLLAAGGVASLVAIAVLDLLPPVARDELTHHLALPALYLRAGRVTEVVFADQSYYPMLLTLLYTPLLAHISEIAPKMLHLAFGLGSAALLLSYLATRVHLTIAIFAALLLFTTPTVAVLSASAYVDLALLFYAAAAIVALLRWHETGRLVFLVASGLAAGCAASTKYNGVLVILLLGAGVILLRPERRGVRPLASAVVFGLASLIPLLPWLVNNLMLTGNPVFPLLNSLLGGRTLPPRPSVDVFSYRRMLYGESWLDIALVPIRVFVTGAASDPARFDGVFNPLYLLGFVASLRAGATRRDHTLGGLATAFLFLGFFLTAFRSRYVLPALIPLVILACEQLDRWRGVSHLPRFVLASVAAAALLFNAAHFADFWQHIDPLPYLRGNESRAQFVTRFVPEYPVAVYANRHLPPEAVVHLAFLGNRSYHWETAYHYDMNSPGTTLLEAVRTAPDADAVGRALASEGITHLASLDSLLDRFMSDNLQPAEAVRWREFTGQHLHPLYRENGVTLYQIG